MSPVSCHPERSEGSLAASVRLAVRAALEAEPVDALHAGRGGGDLVRRPQRQLDRSTVDRRRRRLGARPKKRPVGRREGEADPVAGGKDRARVVELQAHAVAPARQERRRLLVAVVMREVQDAVGDAQRLARGMDVAEPGDEVGDRLVGRKLDVEHRRAEQLDRAVERRGLEGERTRVVLALVVGLVVAAERAPLAGMPAHGPRRRDRTRRQRHLPGRESVVGEEQAMHPRAAASTAPRSSGPAAPRGDRPARRCRSSRS